MTFVVDRALKNQLSVAISSSLWHVNLLQTLRYDLTQPVHHDRPDMTFVVDNDRVLKNQLSVTISSSLWHVNLLQTLRYDLTLSVHHDRPAIYDLRGCLGVTMNHLSIISSLWHVSLV